jgi:hypothetical protein
MKAQFLKFNREKRMETAMALKKKGKPVLVKQPCRSIMKS